MPVPWFVAVAGIAQHHVEAFVEHNRPHAEAFIQHHRPHVEAFIENVNEQAKAKVHEGKPFLDAAAGSVSGFLKQAGQDVSGGIKQLDKRSENESKGEDEEDEEKEEAPAGETHHHSAPVKVLANVTERVFDHAAHWTERANERLQNDPLGTLATVARAVLPGPLTYASIGYYVYKRHRRARA